MQQTIEGLKGSVEELPGTAGTGALARVRDAIGGQPS